MLFASLLGATLLLVIATLLPMWRHPVWWVRGLDFPRMQIALGIAALLLAECLLLDFELPSTAALVLVTLLCLAYQLWWIVPYTAIFPCEVQSAHTRQLSGRRSDNSLRILTANVLTPNRNAGGLLKLIRENDPDVVVTLETDAWWQAQLEPLERAYPHTMQCPLDNLYGMHVYSRLVLSDSHIEFLVEDDVPSMHSQVKLRSGHMVRAHFLHPAPPSPTENAQSSERDAELLVVAQSIADSDEPIVVTGDLNDVAWSATTRLFRKISGLLDPRVGRGMFNTFHADYWFMRWPLDHLFHSEHFVLSSIERLAGFGSDHFPLFTELEYCPAQCENAQQPAGLQATGDDWAQTRVKTDRQNVSPGEVPTPGK